MTTNTQPPPRAEPGGYVLWCRECRRTEACPPDRVVEYARDGWPHCCGRQMFCWAAPDRAPDPE